MKTSILLLSVCLLSSCKNVDWKEVAKEILLREVQIYATNSGK